jgi:outer membrane protein OmpA-like peptidoglycan-associated protein
LPTIPFYLPESSDYFMKKALLSISLALNSALLFEIKAQELPAPINQAGVNETSPSISFDGKTIIYASDKAGAITFLESVKQGEQWNTPTPVDLLNELIKAGYKVQSPSLNYNGTVLYFSSNMSGTLGGTDIFYSERKKGKWTEPVNMGAPINTELDENFPSISSNGRMLFFTKIIQEQTKEKKITQSIYHTTKNEDNAWQTPIQMSPPFNLFFETSPKICADNQTLFFASDRKDDKGNLSLYATKMLLPGMWTLPSPVDTINAKSVSIKSPNVTLQNDIIYFERSVNERKGPQSSVHSFYLDEKFRPNPVSFIEGAITDLFSNKPIAAKIRITEVSTSRIYAELENDPETGEYSAILPKGKQYKLDFFNEGYSHYYITYDTRSGNAEKAEKKDVKLYSYINLLLNVFDKEIFEPLDAQVTVKDLTANKLVQTIDKGSAHGRYDLQLPIGKNYGITLEIENYEPYQFSFDMEKVVRFDAFERDIELTASKKPLLITVKDQATAQPMKVDIRFSNTQQNENLQVSTADEGSLKVSLRKGSTYDMNVQSPQGYAFHSEKVVISPDNQEQQLEILLMPLKQETRLTLNNITFETNSAELNESSFEQLNKLVKLMFDNMNISIEVSAHTDDTGSDAYNNLLSERRAQSMVSYLVEQKIPAERIIAKGYGKTKPLVPNTSEANRATNRRAEMKIIDIK